MDIALIHNHYDKAHLEEVKSLMIVKGAPKIRAIWSEAYGMWMAVEGCHRLRAAEALRIRPIIVDVSNAKTLTIQDDGDNVRVKRIELEEQLVESAWKSHVVRFNNEQE